MTGSQRTVAEVDFACFLTLPDQLSITEKHFSLTKEDFPSSTQILAPCRYFDAGIAALVKKIYTQTPIFIKESPEVNPWNAKFMQGLFNKTTDSGYFHGKDELEGSNFRIKGQTQYLQRRTKDYVPLFEGRMIHFFDHRRASVGTSEQATFRSGLTIETTDAEHSNPDYSAFPRYWVDKRIVENSIPAEYSRLWFIGFKDVTSSTNERTMICSIIPRVGISNEIPLIITDKEAHPVSPFPANLSSYLLDFVARQKVGGMHLNFYIVNQLPILPPEAYDKKILDRISSIVLELVFTSNDISPFARDLSYSGAPF